MHPGLAILGAGIGGLSAARACQLNGVPFQLYDHAKDPLQGGAALTLWPNAIRALSRLGVIQDSADWLQAIQSGDVRTDRNGRLYELPIEWMRHAFGAAPACVSRQELITRIYDTLGKPDIFQAHADTVASQAGGASVTFSGGSTEIYEGVIVADGIHSSLRELFLGISPRTLAYTAWRGIAVGADVPAYSMREYWGQGVRFGYATIDGTATYWFATANQRRLLADESTWWDIVNRQLMQFPNEVESCLKHTPTADVLHTPVQDIRPGMPMSFGNVALIGDAAHAITPNFGFGACLALEDALVLNEELSRGNRNHLHRTFASYSRRRIQRVATVARITRWSGHVMQAERASSIALRNLITRHVPKSAARMAWRRLLRG